MSILGSLRSFVSPSEIRISFQLLTLRCMSHIWHALCNVLDPEASAGTDAGSVRNQSVKECIVRRWLTGFVALAAIICYTSAAQAGPNGHHGGNGNHDHYGNGGGHHGNSYHAYSQGGFGYGGYPVAYRGYPGPVCGPVAYVPVPRVPVYPVPVYLYPAPVYGGGTSYSFGYSSPGLSFWFGR